MSGRPVATYSIVARDDTHIGVAVQSHWYNVGAVVPWVDASVGAVAAQSFSPPEVGHRALAGLAAGRPPRQILDELISDDVQRAGGQIAILRADGEVATHTGDGCIPEAGHVVGERFTSRLRVVCAKGRPVWCPRSLRAAGCRRRCLLTRAVAPASNVSTDSRAN